MSKTLTLQTVNREVFEISVEPNAQIGQVKRILVEKHNVPANCQIVFNGHILNDEVTIDQLDTEGHKLIVHTPTPTPTVTDPGVSGTAGAVSGDPTPAPAPRPPAAAPATTTVQAPPQPSGPLDPSNFGELVGQLTEMGFPAEQCQLALRRSHYNIDNAVNMLLSGQIGSAGDASDFHPAAEYPGASSGSISHGTSGLGPSYPTSAGRFGPVQSTYDELTPEEKAAVDRLCATGHDPTTVLQIYVACDKNEEATRKNLQ